MPLPMATLDDRTYQDLVNEALARIPVHNPEWTNFNESDPGVTLLELFAFLTESLLYRANQIPDRNRVKFLSLLGVGLRPATSAQGLVAFSNDRGPLQTVTLSGDVEVRAGQVAFRTDPDQGLDVLPVEAQVYFKRQAAAPTDQQSQDYYAQLYASYLSAAPAPTLQFYETVPLSAVNGIDLASDPIDGAVWVALLIRAGDKPAANTDQGWATLADQVRAQLANRTLSVGVVPYLTGGASESGPGATAAQSNAGILQLQLPSLPPGGMLPADPAQRVPQYQLLPTAYPSQSVLDEPGVVQVTLPGADALGLWQNLAQLEPGVGDFPPDLQDTTLEQRLLTWLRVSARDPVTGGPSAAQAGLLWLGINAATVTQRAHVANELLPAGTGEPDQTATLSQTPVVPGSVQLSVTSNGTTEQWQEVPDLSVAGPEVPAPDPRQPPGVPPVVNPLVKVFTVDAESGVMTFGDGTRGTRPPYNAVLRASYDFGAGTDGNVGPGAINSGPTLPAGFSVSNPVRTWGGADAETVAQGEKQITRYLQHRDRLVNATDFESIALRTPGANVGRVDVIAAYSPALATNEPGDVPGAVTLMVVPSYDPQHPDTPEPDNLFLSTVCDYLAPRRLVTTELYVRGPDYLSIVVSVGVQVVGGLAAAPVYEAVKQALVAFLSPLPASPDDALDSQEALLTAPQLATLQKGWPRNKPVVALELLAVASRVSGVSLVNEVQIALPGGAAVAQIDMPGLSLPRVTVLSVTGGDPVPVAALSGQAPATTAATSGGNFLPVPVIPEECWRVDANGTRYQLLLGYDDWGACSDALTPPGAVPLPLRSVWEASPPGSASSDLASSADRSELTLRGLLLRLTSSRGYVAPTLDARRGAGRDRYGNWYWIAASGTELLVNSVETANTSHFWSPGDGLACPPRDPSLGAFQAQGTRPPPAALALAGLAVTEEHYLVVGVLEPAGLLIFDLHAGGPPRQVFWPAAVPFVPFDMAPAPGGGVWILDRVNTHYWALDRQFRVIVRDQAEAAAPARDDFRPLAGGAVSRTPALAFPEGIRLDVASPLAARDPIAVEALPDGTVLILDRNPGGPNSLVARYRFGQQLGEPVPTVIPPDLVEDGTTAGLPIVAHDFAFVPEHLAADGTTVLDRLYVVGKDGDQGFAFLLSQQGGQLAMRALTDDLPLRLFGGKGLVAACCQVYYDFADRWIPLAPQCRPRYAASADLYTPANVPAADGSLPPRGGRPPFDGRVPDCVWHRLMLDACIPPQAQVVVWSRAANSPADLARAEWQQEPPPYLRGDGSELPFVPPRSAPGDGTWELLFQNARGRYLQLRLNLSGNQRATPRLRALRAYYPRFSYLERYLPAVYRKDSASASFLDRFLANPEGSYTALEGRIAAAQMLFDPVSAPAADLAWLAGWFGVILDPTWDERKQRLFLKNAMLFFQYRGTARGLEMALRLANDPCAEQDVFDDPASAAAPRSFRIVEWWQARKAPGLLPAGAAGGPQPGQGPAPARWTPDQGGAALNLLYTRALTAAGAPPGPTVTFPLVAPADQTAAVWTQFARAALGFAPSTSAADAGRWQDFLARRYRRVSALNGAYGTGYATFADVSLPQSLPADGAPLVDWYQFQSVVLTAYQSAHRFTVLLPAPPTNANGAAQQARLELTRRVIDLEKPAHTIYDVQFYWAYFRVGSVRLGDDSIIDRGSRAPQLLPPLVLGQGYLAGSHLAPTYPQNVRERPVVGATASVVEPRVTGRSS